MKKFLFLLSIAMVLLLPNLLLSHYYEEPMHTQPDSGSIDLSVSKDIMIRVEAEDGIYEMPLEEYLLCVLLGEMPVDFEPEALKAQSVATRTYTLRKTMKQGKHIEADVCTDASCCHAFVSEADLLKMKYVLNATAGEVLTYQGNLIEATYFSCSGGKTEDAMEVWGTSVPYLQSVDSPGEENAKHFADTFEFTVDEFCKKLGLTIENGILETDLTITHTEGNGVDRLVIGNTILSGVQVRTLLSLPSTAFELSIDNDVVVIHTKGYGHRVGMSQYGADAMALAGKNYHEILAHYYPGTQLEKFNDQ